MKYINADLIEYHEEYDGQGFTRVAYADDIENLPTADVKPVVRGEWIPLDDGRYKCSHCGMKWKLIGTPECNGMYYCLNCGAEMFINDDITVEQGW